MPESIGCTESVGCMEGGARDLWQSGPMWQECAESQMGRGTPRMCQKSSRCHIP